MVRFLRICAPLDNPENFKRLIIRPLKNADPTGTEILRVCVSSPFGRDAYSPRNDRLSWHRYA